MTMMQIRTYETQDEASVVELWKQCGLTRPWNDPRKDIRRKLAAQPELFFVGLVDDNVVGTVMVGYEGHRGWINYLAVSPELQKRGLGRLLMQHAERTLVGLGCPKINLQMRSSNGVATAFYRRLGYVEDDVVSFGKRLEHDDPSALPE
jgi:ribosomal protein S18 acetylase RimI-like enzyme